MTQAREGFMSKVARFSVPHVLVLIIFLILICCGLTYILPAGVYDVDPTTNKVIADSFHYVDPSPVSPWQALLSLTAATASQGVIFALLFIMGGLVSVVIDCGSINALINYAVYKLEDKSIKVLVPSIVVLMSVVGGLAGQDSLVAFVAVGILLVKKLRLDKIAAMAIFYLSYITGQAAGPTIAIILMAQEAAEIPPVSGIGCRLIVWAALTLLCVVFTTRYCLLISKDPSKSILGYVEEPDKCDLNANAVPVLGIKDVITVACLFVPFAFYAFGAANYGWGFKELLAFAVIDVLVIGLVNRINMNDLAVMFLKGATAMGGICLMIGFAKVIGVVLTDGKILHTLAHAAVTIIGGLGDYAVASGIFVFTTLFNLLVPSGPAKVPMLMPLFIPVGDVLGITRQVLCLAFQLGDGLTNFATPVSAVLAAALSMTGVNYVKWMKFVFPYIVMCFIIAIVSLTILQAIGWS